MQIYAFNIVLVTKKNSNDSPSKLFSSLSFIKNEEKLTNIDGKKCISLSRNFISQNNIFSLIKFSYREDLNYFYIQYQCI